MEEIGQAIGRAGPAEACRDPVNLALDRGGTDTMTALVFRITGVPITEPSGGGRRGLFPWRTAGR